MEVRENGVPAGPRPPARIYSGAKQIDGFALGLFIIAEGSYGGFD